MIGFLKGRVLRKQPPFILMDVNGVGYELEAPMPTFYDLPDENHEAMLHVHLVVREDAHLLFGFSDRAQRELFRNLLKVNGVGPRVGLAILSTLSAADFIHCVNSEDAATLTRVPGIGKKTAERMIIDMRDRIELEAAPATGAAPVADAGDDPVRDAIGALIALGYKPAEAGRAVNAVHERGEAREDLIRNALKHITER